MNPWYASIEILNHMFIVNQGPEQVDQVCKIVLNPCGKALLLYSTVNLCLPGSLRPCLDLLRPGYALLHIPPRQFGVYLTIIQIDRLQSRLASPFQYMRKAFHGEEGLGCWKTESLLYFDSSASLYTKILPPPSLLIPTIFAFKPKFSNISIIDLDRKTPPVAVVGGIPMWVLFQYILVQ